MFRRRKRVSVGLDVGTKMLKVLVLSGDVAKREFEVVTYGVRPIPKSADGQEDRNVADFIRAVFSELRIDERRVHTAVSGSSAIVRYVPMPKMRLEDLRSSIRYEAAQHIPIDIKEVEMDCAVVDTDDGTGTGRMKVLLVAARKTDCQRLVKILQWADLTPVLIEVDSLSVVNAFLERPLDGQDGPTALTHIGAKKTIVNIVDDGKPAFTRNIEIGGDGVSLAISRATGMALDEAERLKVMGEAVVKEPVEIVLNSLVRQLRSSFDYYEGMSGKDVARLYLSGGSASLTGMADFVHSAIGLPTALWNPIEGAGLAVNGPDGQLAAFAPALDVALGLALRCPEVAP